MRMARKVENGNRKHKDSIYDLRDLVKAPINAALISDTALSVIKCIGLLIGLVYFITPIVLEGAPRTILYMHSLSSLVIYYNCYFITLWVIDIMRTKISKLSNSKNLGVYIVASYFRTISIGCMSLISVNRLEIE